MLLDSLGFHGQYDFVYLPLSFNDGLNIGFAFVNFVTNASARCALYRLSCWCEVAWSQKRQGLREHIQHYQGTALMSPDMPDEFKPILLAKGVRVDFPGDGCKRQECGTRRSVNLESALS